MITFNYDTLVEHALASVYVDELNSISEWDCLPILFASSGYAVLRGIKQPFFCKFA